MYILLLFAGVIGLAFVGVYINELIARRQDGKKYPPPGKLVNVGGRQLHLHAIGEGSPTVVMDAGMGDSSLTWCLVQQEVAKFTRVCTFDRAGLGWSETSGRPRTYEKVVTELYELLTNAGEQAPYILIGHSSGGFTARLFAQNYPDEVAGIVLVDPSDETSEFWNEEENRNKMIKLLRTEIMPASIGLYRLLARQIWGRTKRHLPAVMLYHAPFLTSAKNLRTMIHEIEALPESHAQVTTTRHSNVFGNLPLIVITATQNPDEIAQGIDSWVQWHKNLSELSTKGTQILAESGHNIQHEQPQLVADSIHTVVEQARETTG